MNVKKQMTVGALLSYGAIAFNIVAGLVYTPWMIDTIGRDQYALYTLSLSIINIFLLDFGIGSAVTKFLSGYYAEGKHEEANRFLGIVYKVFIGISAIAALALGIFYLFIDVIYVKLTPEEVAVFKRLFIIVASYSVLSFPFTTFNGTLLANEQFVAIKACNFGQKVLDVALIVILMLLGRGVYALVLVHAFSNFVFLVLKYVFLRRSNKCRADMRSWDADIAKKLFGFSAWHTVMSIARRGIYNVMPTIIAALVGSAEVTLFSLAATIEGYVFTFTDAINGMFMPKISRILSADNATDNLSKLMINVGKFHVYSLGLLFIGFLCVGSQFVVLWLGEEYSLVYICAVILIAPSLIETPQQVARTALLAKDVVKEQALLYVGMAVLNLVIAFILLNIFGIVGAAASVAASYALKIVGLNILYYKRLGINLSRYFSETYMPWLFVAIVSAGLGCFVSALPVTGWGGLIFKAGIICAVYVLLLVIFCIKIDSLKYAIKRVFSKR